MKLPFLCIAVSFAYMFCFSASVSLAANQFTETFTTTTYKDAANTTADWNTGAGELRLFPFAPSLVGSYNTPGTSLGVSVVGDLTFVADYDHGLQIINITSPASPTLVGSYDTPGSAAGVAVAGDLAFVADGASGLQIINITNPASPTLVGSYDTPGTAYGIAVAGDLAFVADISFGLQIINITNPASPTLVGSYDTPGNAVGIAVAGDLAFVADGASGLQIIDITTPASPTLTGTYDTPGFASGIAVAGDLAFVADDLSNLQIINIATPASPTLTGTYDTPGTSYDVVVEGDLAFVAENGGLQIIKVSGLMTSPTLIGSYDTPGQAYGVAVAGDLAFVADNFGGLRIIDIINPASPTAVGTYGASTALGVVVAGDLAFVAGHSAGLQIIDIISPASPTLVGSYDTPGLAVGVAVAGDLAFVADWTSGLQIINITNPASPTLAGSYDTPGTANGIAVAGDLVFVADWASGLEIINITNPASPTLVGSYDTPGEALGVAVAGDLAFVADGASGLQIIDITNPASPTPVGSYDTPGYARGVAVAGDLAFVADDVSGLQIINITNPASPTVVGAHNTPGLAFGVVVAGDLAFVADHTAGLQAIQVYNHEVDQSRNIGRSLAVDGSADVIRRARLTTTQTAGVGWEVSVNNGASWQAITPNNAWSVFTVGGSDLVWRSTHTWAPGLNPTASDLHLEWLYDNAAIGGITDIPNDQGRWVRVNFARSGHDFADEVSVPITGYGIWRRVDNVALLATLVSASRTSAPIDGAIKETFGGLPLFANGDRVFVQSGAPGVLAAGFPPGTWELVQSAFALQKDSYLAAIPTEADSTLSGTSYTVLVVTAHTPTPSIWYASAPDSGYSIDNLAPSVPTNFAIAYNTGSGNTLSWDGSPDTDFQYFRVYRSSDPNFTPSAGTLVHSTINSGWVDPNYRGGGVYYKVTATDFSGNESGPASAGTITSANGPAIPKTFALYPNVPNPFNPTTLIRYDVPEKGGEVALRIYDVSGRLVITLVQGAQTAGEKSATWDGRDDAGQPVASGVYFYKLVAGSFVDTKKMVLLK